MGGMKTAIENFPKQFSYEPKIENKDNLESKGKFVVIGMGGSHLAADLLKVWNPYLDLIIHKDYGLPPLSLEDLENRLIIVSSYSGNTEETVDAFEKAKEKNLQIAVISTGGELIKLAKKTETPYIKMPNTGIQPRSALGLSFKGLLKLIGEEDTLEEIKELTETLDPGALEQKGHDLAKELKGKVPVIYSGTRNGPIAYNWKIKFNETGKVPAFCNILPELNHNEMTGFDVQSPTKELSKNFSFIFLKDASDQDGTQKRMKVLKELYKDRKLPVKEVALEGETEFEKIFSSLILADWAAYYTADFYGLEPEQVPMVEEFKGLIK
ncbi:bifunctional phosphoglucose/phosphomannose isomerase [bacterium]|nr:bifunctional phosphoglucose/phosphomannose isomerase [bacterium]|tara:strand:- start:137 stop:1111 length:975 start_codon:yes stop_codon:yes gene_type:complete